MTLQIATICRYGGDIEETSYIEGNARMMFVRLESSLYEVQNIIASSCNLTPSFTLRLVYNSCLLEIWDDNSWRFICQANHPIHVEICVDFPQTVDLENAMHSSHHAYGEPNSSAHPHF